MAHLAVNKSLLESLAHPPVFDWALPETGDSLDEFKRLVDGFYATMDGWRAKTSVSVARVISALEEGFIASEREGLPTNAPELLEEAISAVERSIEGFRVPFHDSPKMAQKIDRLQILPASARRFVMKQIRRIEDLRVTQYNASVDWYYALLALQSEHDPHAEKVGVFSDPDMLEASLRKEAV